MQTRISKAVLISGTAQGWALWFLWQAHENGVWPADDAMWFSALAYVAIGVPLLIFWSEGARLSWRSRWLGVSLFTVALAVLGAYAGWSENPLVRADAAWQWRPNMSHSMASAILCFVSLHLWAAFDAAQKRWDYQHLFELSWRNTVTSALAGVMLGVFWMVLEAGAALMSSIEFGFVRELIHRSILALPISGVVFATAYGLALLRADTIVMLRRFRLSITAWFLPLLLGFALMWVIALPIAGVAPLFRTKFAAFFLLWFTALAVKFANSAYQDGSAPAAFNKSLRVFVQGTWLCLPVVVAIAAWAMFERIGQHGLTEDRIWGLFVLLIAAGYALGYAVSVVPRFKWMESIEKTNIVVAVVLCAGLVMLTTPISDPRRIAVSAQLSRLAAQADSSQFDYRFLRWDAGRYGVEALNELTTQATDPRQQEVAARAKAALQQKNRYAAPEQAPAIAVDLKRIVQVLPAGRTLSPALENALLRADADWRITGCAQAEAQCLVWFIDLDDDRIDEAVVMNQKNGAQLAVLGKAGDDYVVRGMLRGRMSRAELQRAIESGKLALKPSQWKNVVADSHELQFVLDY